MPLFDISPEHQHLRECLEQKRRLEHMTREYNALIAHATSLLNSYEAGLSRLLDHIEGYHQAIPRQDQELQEAYQRYNQVKAKLQQHLATYQVQGKGKVPANEGTGSSTIQTSDKGRETPISIKVNPAATTAGQAEPQPRVTLYQNCGGVMTPVFQAPDTSKPANLNPGAGFLVSAPSPAPPSEARPKSATQPEEPLKPIRHWCLPVQNGMSLDELLKLDPTDMVTPESPQPADAGNLPTRMEKEAEQGAVAGNHGLPTELVEKPDLPAATGAGGGCPHGPEEGIDASPDHLPEN